MRAGLVERATGWRWSSVHAQLGAPDGLTATAAVAARFPDFAALLAAGEDAEMSRRLRRAETIGRPIGDDAFVRALERRAGRPFAPGRRGRKPRAKISALSP